jgi:hypothetical protein
MTVYDVRCGDDSKIEEVVFADKACVGGSYQAYKIAPNVDGDVKLIDGSGDYVYVNSENHARNLIKALEKAIELGWLQ